MEVRVDGHHVAHVHSGDLSPTIRALSQKCTAAEMLNNMHARELNLMVHAYACDAMTPSVLALAITNSDWSIHRLCVYRFQNGLKVAALADTELIALDSLHLQTQHLAQLVQQLQLTGEHSALTVLSLEDNVLTDDACAVLRDALSDSTFCPQLMKVNLNGNVGITPLGHEHLKQPLEQRPDLKARPSSCAHCIANQPWRGSAIDCYKWKSHPCMYLQASS